MSDPYETPASPPPDDPLPRPDDPDDPPPLLGTWRNLYTLTLGALFFQIVLYAWLSQVLS